MKVTPSPLHHELSEKRIIKLIQPISQILCLSVPNLYDYNGLAVLYILYSALLISSLVALCAYGLYFKMIVFYRHLIKTAVILDTVAIIGTTVTSITSVALAVIFRRRKMVQLIKTLKDVEGVLNEKFDVVCHLDDKSLLVQFGCLEIVVFSYIVFDCVFEIRENGLVQYTWSIIMHFNILMISLIVMQVQLLSTIIQQYFMFLNDRLWHSMRYPVTGKDKNPTFGSIKMKFFLKNYDKLCDGIDLVSKSFGIQVAAISFIIIVSLIGSMNLMMKFALGMEMMKTDLSVTLLLVASTWNSVIFIIFGVMLAICCERASSEANFTSVICYKILLDFPSCPKTHYEEITKNELMLLAEHLSQRKVKFSAAGLFAIDHTMLYMIFGSIAAYLVIVLQFK